MSMREIGKHNTGNVTLQAEDEYFYVTAERRFGWRNEDELRQRLKEAGFSLADPVAYTAEDLKTCLMIYNFIVCPNGRVFVAIGCTEERLGRKLCDWLGSVLAASDVSTLEASEAVE